MNSYLWVDFVKVFQRIINSLIYIVLFVDFIIYPRSYRVSAITFSLFYEEILIKKLISIVV